MRWFVLRVKGRRAAKIVETIGEACWRPVEKRWTKPHGKHQAIEVDVPLIPGWIFVKADQYRSWDSLDGVYGVLKFGRLGTLWIENEDLEGLRAACLPPAEGPQGQLDAVDWLPPIGSTVKLRGILAGRLGTVLRALGQSNYRVEVDGMAISISSRLLEPA